MSDLRELYQELIIDHGRRPRNFGALVGHNHHAEGFNPLCGDKLTLYLRIDDGVITAASFEGNGCTISTASASLMTEALKGKSPAQAEALCSGFQAMVTGAAPPPPQLPDAPEAVPLGKLKVLAGVQEFPVRVKCATLAWHTLRAALRDQTEPISTE